MMHTKEPWMIKEAKVTLFSILSLLIQGKDKELLVKPMQVGCSEPKFQKIGKLFQ